MSAPKRWLLGALLLVEVAAVYALATRNGFVAFDDDDYVYKNPMVMRGLTPDGVKWAFTTGHAANYHPLTWLSHMADVSMFGDRAAGHHFTNVVLHALNAILLFLVLARMTGNDYRPWMVATVFAVHPLHVESVAWVSQRKDLLCALFMFLGIWAYAYWTKTQRRGTFSCVVAAFILALLSKPVAVTFPFLLIVLDFWPLGRFQDGSISAALPRRVLLLIREKMPLFVLTALACGVTFFVQRLGGAMHALNEVPLWARAANAVVAYVSYLVKMVWPVNLSPIYPHPGESIALGTTALGLLLLLALSIAAWHARNRAPYVLAGWLWYLGLLVPMIGIVQVGYAAMADRYTYMPMTGIVIAVVWAIGDTATKWPSYARLALFGVGGVAVVAFAVLAHAQVRIWSTSESLFKHAIATTTDNAEAHAHLGVVYLERNKPGMAVAPLESAVRIRPELKQAWASLGAAYRMTRRTPDAVTAYNRALDLDPVDASVHASLGIAYVQLGDNTQAEAHLREAIRLDPRNRIAHWILARLLEAQGKHSEAEGLRAIAGDAPAVNDELVPPPFNVEPQ